MRIERDHENGARNLIQGEDGAIRGTLESKIRSSRVLQRSLFLRKLFRIAFELSDEFTERRRKTAIAQPVSNYVFTDFSMKLDGPL